MSDPSILEIFGEFAAKYAVVQSAIAAGVFLYIQKKIINKGEKDQPTADELRARWQSQQDMHDMSENLKSLLVLHRQIYELMKRMIDVQWNKEQQ